MQKQTKDGKRLVISNQKRLFLRASLPATVQPKGRAEVTARHTARTQKQGAQVRRRAADLQPALRRAEGWHLADVPPAPRGIRARREIAEAWPRQRGGVLHPRRRGLRDP